MITSAKDVVRFAIRMDGYDYFPLPNGQIELPFLPHESKKDIKLVLTNLQRLSYYNNMDVRIEFCGVDIGTFRLVPGVPFAIERPANVQRKLVAAKAAFHPGARPVDERYNGLIVLHVYVEKFREAVSYDTFGRLEANPARLRSLNSQQVAVGGVGGISYQEYDKATKLTNPQFLGELKYRFVIVDTYERPSSRPSAPPQANEGGLPHIR